MTKPKAITYSKLVAEAAEKYANSHVDLSDPEADEESMKEHAFCSNHCASVLESPVVKELIEQIASEAIQNAAWSGYGGESYVDLDLEWFKTFMKGEDENVG